ncbi:MAG: competence/damage-inducible protein A, partial [Alphaproteobacteria bacterium]
SMADMPVGADLIDNPVSIAPGFRVENVHVMAGVPKIMQAMLDNVLPTLKGGAVVLSRSVTLFMPEGELAAHLGKLQDEHPDLDIGSYPFFGSEGPGSTIVFRGIDQDRIDQAANALLALASGLGVRVIDGAARN